MGVKNDGIRAAALVVLPAALVTLTVYEPAEAANATSAMRKLLEVAPEIATPLRYH
jgi:hypothetical protein